MSRIVGDLPQLDALKSTFDRQSQAVEELTSVIRNELGNVAWEGPAADRFRSAWSSEFEPALGRLQTALQEAGTEVQQRRMALETAGS